MTNKYKGTLYIGFTDDLKRRVYEHKNEEFDGFTKRYKLQKLVYCEEIQSCAQAAQREKSLKRWLREWKIKLINSQNPDWQDLSDKWVTEEIES